MRKEKPVESADAYVAAIDGWRRPLVEQLRAAVHRAAPFEERIKWGHIVYFANGACMLIRAEDARVLLGFWRGKRLTGLEARLETGGKYEMGRIVLREGDVIGSDTVAKLAAEAHRLNFEVGDPTARR